MDLERLKDYLLSSRKVKRKKQEKLIGLEVALLLFLLLMICVTVLIQEIQEQ